jgi:hypothetical protein
VKLGVKRGFIKAPNRVRALSLHRPTFHKILVNYICCSSAGSNKGDNFTCVIIAVKVKAKVFGKSYDELEYMAKVMPVNEYRAMWLEEVIFYSIHFVKFFQKNILPVFPSNG